MKMAATFLGPDCLFREPWTIDHPPRDGVRTGTLPRSLTDADWEQQALRPRSTIVGLDAQNGRGDATEVDQ